MSNSERITHRFTDEEVSNIEVAEYYVLSKETAYKGVYFDTENVDTGGVTTTFLSEDDLLYLLKLIEEIN